MKTKTGSKLRIGGPVFLLVLITAAAIVPAAQQTHLPPDGSLRDKHKVAADDLYKSPVQMALSRDGRSLYVTCENTDELLRIDTRSGKVIASVKVGSYPLDITLSPDQKRIYVANRRGDNIHVLDRESFSVVDSIATVDDPHGLIVSPDGKVLFTANLTCNNVQLFSTETGEEIKLLDVGWAPFSLALSPDGRQIAVSNQFSNRVPYRTAPVSEATLIDVQGRTVSGRRDLYNCVVSQGVQYSADGKLALFATEMPRNLLPETQIYQGWMVVYGLALVEARPDGRVAYLIIDETNLYYADPYSLAVTPDGRRVYVASSGANVVTVLDMEKVAEIFRIEDGRIGLSDSEIADYARNLGISYEYVAARIEVGNNPKGMVISPDGKRVYVANRLSDNISVIDTKLNRVVKTIHLGGPDVTTELRRGERLFNYASISFQKQMSCATCHPEMHLDGLNYDIAADGGMGYNIVRNQSLRGISMTPPYKWSGKNPNLQRQEGPRAAQLFFRSNGFEPDGVQAIVKFIESQPFPRSRFKSKDGKLTAAQRRGKQIFERSYDSKGNYIPVANRCVTCHAYPYGTDRMKHDVGTWNYFDTEEEFDTPQLNDLLAKAPFLHDGRTHSLEEIWTVFSTDDTHGITGDMNKLMLNDLIEYIKIF
ncbi:hypothetical protein ACFLT7_01240 [candidate division KSB1 bacterium]